MTAIFLVSLLLGSTSPPDACQPQLWALGEEGVRGSPAHAGEEGKDSDSSRDSSCLLSAVFAEDFPLTVFLVPLKQDYGASHYLSEASDRAGPPSPRSLLV